MNIIAQKLKRPYIPHSTMHIFWYIYYTYPSRVMQLISCHWFTLHFGVCWAFMLSIGPEKNSIYLSFPFTIFYLSSRLSVVEKNRTRHGGDSRWAACSATVTTQTMLILDGAGEFRAGRSAIHHWVVECPTHWNNYFDRTRHPLHSSGLQGRQLLFTFLIAFHPSPPRSSEAIFVGSSLKSVTWLPLPWIRRRPPCDTWNCSFHPDGDSHLFHLDGNSVRPTFHLLRISHIRNSVRTTFHLLRIFHSQRLSPDGRGGWFNFPG